MAGLTPAHLVLILIIALVVIGPGKLPELGSAIGKSVHEFQKATGQITDPQPAAPPSPAVQQSWAAQPVPQPMQVAPAPYYAPPTYALLTPAAPQAPAPQQFAAEPAPFAAGPAPFAAGPASAVPQTAADADGLPPTGAGRG